MWIFTSNSYLSIVEHRELPNHFFVRARNKGDIESIFPSADVVRTPEADYLFRAPIHKSLVINAITEELDNIDYDNFKNSITDHRYHDACLDVWFTMNDYQQAGAPFAKA